MSIERWIAAITVLLSVDAIAIAWLIERRPKPTKPASWFDHQRFLDRPPVERVREYTPATIVHPCSFGGDLLEYPLARGWDEEAILDTLAEIEAL